MPSLVKFADYGSTRKTYYRNNERAIDHVVEMGTTFFVVDTIPEDIELPELKEMIQYYEEIEEGVMFLNGKAPEHGGSFTRREVQHEESKILFVDIDWTNEAGFVDLPNPERPLLEKARYAFDKMDFPECGMILKTSSSGYIDLEYNKLCLHAFILLEEPIQSDQFKEMNSHLMNQDIGLDHAIYSRGQPVFIQRPFKEEDVNWIDRPDTIILKEGERLNIHDLSDAHLPNDIEPQGSLSVYQPGGRKLGKVSHIETANKNHGKERQISLYELIKRRLGNDKKKTNRALRDWEKVKEITLSLAEDGELNKTRNRTLWDLLVICFNLNRSFDEALDLIRSNRSVRGDWTEKNIQQKLSNLDDRYCLDRWSAGDVSISFNPEEIKKVEVLDLKDLGDDLIESIPKEGVVLLKSGCGSGKTSGIIKRIIKDFDRILGVTHRRAILEGICPREKLDLTYYLDAGIDQVDEGTWEGLSEKARKELFVPDEDNLAITIQSLKYTLRDGAIQRPFDVVFIDEVEQVLDSLRVTPTIANDQSVIRQLSLSLQALLLHCEMAKLVIVADDSASHELTSWFVNLIAHNSEKRKFLLKNDRDYVEEMIFYSADSLYEILWSTAMQIREGKKIAIMTDQSNKKGTLEKWKRILLLLTELEDHQIQWFDASSFEGNDDPLETVRGNPEEVIPALIDDGLMCFIGSPAFESGWSYLRDEKKYNFDEVQAIAMNRHTHHQAIKSWIRRFRLTHIGRTFIANGYNPDKTLDDMSEWDIKGRLADPLEALDKRSKQALRKRQENVRLAFEMDMESLGASVKRNNIEYLEHDEIYIKELAKEAEVKEVDQIRADEIQKDIKLAYQFVTAKDQEETTKLEGSIRLLDECKQFKSNDMGAMLELWEMDIESVRELQIDAKDVYLLQRILLDEVEQVLAKTFGIDDMEGAIDRFYDWCIDGKQEKIIIFLTDTPEMDKFKRYVNQNHNDLKQGVLWELGSKGKTQSPSSLLKIFGKRLFLQCLRKTPSQAKDVKGKKPEIKKELYDLYGYKKGDKEIDKRKRAVDRLKKKLNKYGEGDLNPIEKKFLRTYERLEISKKSYQPRGLIDHIRNRRND